MRTTYFGEAIDLTEATFDKANNTMRVTLIRPGWSKNGRHYSKQVLKDSAALFEGTKAYADHPSKLDRKNRPERSVTEIVGYYKNVKPESDGRLTATLKILDEKIQTLAQEAIDNAPTLIGLSINALGTTRKGEFEGKKGIIVESIVKANSTDVVTTPAAGGSFDNLLMSNGDEFTADLLAAISLEEIREARPDFEKALKKEFKTPRNSAALVAARDKNKSLESELQEAKKAVEKHDDETRALKEEIISLQADRLIDATKLPQKWKDALRETLRELPVSRWDAVIEQELAKAKSLPRRRPVRVTGAGRSTAPATPKAKPGNPVAESLGVKTVARDNESVTAYLKRKRLEEAKQE